MEATAPSNSEKSRVRLVLVDDSEAFRKFITEILADNAAVTVVGTAAGGVQALDCIDKLNPDVVLLDLEMPDMDGMETLHTITERFGLPVVMLSSLSREGSARSFDCLRRGAVDFIGKGALSPGAGMQMVRSELVFRVLCAARLQVDHGPWAADTGADRPHHAPSENRVVFCEECGARNVVASPAAGGSSENPCCGHCGDPLEAIVISHYRRVSAIAVIGAGRGAAGNLLRIIPRLPAHAACSLIVVVHESREYAASLCRYLSAFSSIRVVALEDGLNIEGGACYIGSSHDHFVMVSNTANHTIRKGGGRPGKGALDQMLESISSVMKNRMLAMVLSGSQLDGEHGMRQVRKNGGGGVVLNASNCLCRELGENILRKGGADRIVSERECLDLLLHFPESALAQAP